MSKVLNLLSPAHGQCRLDYVSATEIKLSRYNGANLSIAGLPQTIPGAGVSASNSGLSNSTLYYVYAWMDDGDMALELSATGYEADEYGVQVKTGDADHTLVGMVRTTSGGQFENTTSRRMVASWFNRRATCAATGTLSDQTANTSFEALTGGSAAFLCWEGEAAQIEIVGSVSSDTAGNNIHTTSAGLDGSTTGAQTIATTFNSGVSLPAYASAVVYPSEGYHYVEAFGKVSAGTGTWSYGIHVQTAE